MSNSFEIHLNGSERQVKLLDSCQLVGYSLCLDPKTLEVGRPNTITNYINLYYTVVNSGGRSRHTSAHPVRRESSTNIKKFTS